MQICKVPSPVRTNLEVSKFWSRRVFNKSNWTVNLRASPQKEVRKTMTVSVQMGFVDIAKVFEAVGCFYHYFLCQKVRRALTDKDNRRGTKQRNEMQKPYVKEKGYTDVKLGT